MTERFLGAVLGAAGIVVFFSAVMAVLTDGTKEQPFAILVTVIVTAIWVISVWISRFWNWLRGKPMKQEDAKAAIIREWMALPFSERQTDWQAASFAMKIKDKFPFKCSGDRYQVVKAWLQHQLSVTPKTP